MSIIHKHTCESGRDCRSCHHRRWCFKFCIQDSLALFFLKWHKNCSDKVLASLLSRWFLLSSVVICLQLLISIQFSFTAFPLPLRTFTSSRFLLIELTENVSMWDCLCYWWMESLKDDEIWGNIWGRNCATNASLSSGSSSNICCSYMTLSFIVFRLQLYRFFLTSVFLRVMRECLKLLHFLWINFGQFVMWNYKNINKRIFRQQNTLRPGKMCQVYYTTICHPFFGSFSINFCGIDGSLLMYVWISEEGAEVRRRQSKKLI